MSELRNAQAVALSALELLPVTEWRERIVAQAKASGRIAALFGRPHDGRVRLLAILADDERGSLTALQTEVGDTYPALTPECPQAHWFEREIAEQWSVVPEGHPWLKPIRFHGSYRPGLERAPAPVVGTTSFFQVEGEEVHEVAVGPVHAGIIEPGHFRFQCHGEQVMHLEISLGYQHRGVERALVGGPHRRTLFQMEAVAGDTSIGHASAYCQALEALAGCEIPPRAAALRGIALELERLANHTGDLGALAGDIGYLPTASFCGRLRGDFLNMTAVLCGSRFGRALVKPGGVCIDVNAERIDDLLRRLVLAEKDVRGAVDMLWRTPSVQGRFEYVGKVSHDDALALGLVGPPARAAGLERDVRRDHPVGIWRVAQVPVATMPYGDVYSRAYVRWLEIERSIAFVREQLKALPAGTLRAEVGALKASALAVSLVEGWRGEIAHVALTGEDGRFASYKVVDPSFHNWFGLALALRELPISDFPLCNKSFNLSYCGHDL